jgi:hypothetical protein
MIENKNNANKTIERPFSRKNFINLPPYTSDFEHFSIFVARNYKNLELAKGVLRFLYDYLKFYGGIK